MAQVFEGESGRGSSSFTLSTGFFGGGIREKISHVQCLCSSLESGKDGHGVSSDCGDYMFEHADAFDHVFLAGDFNGGVGDLEVAEMAGVECEGWLPARSQDRTTNEQGRTLIELVSSAELAVLNRNTPSAKALGHAQQAQFSCFPPRRGASVIDFQLTDFSLFQEVVVFDLKPMGRSDHFAAVSPWPWSEDAEFPLYAPRARFSPPEDLSELEQFVETLSASGSFDAVALEKFVTELRAQGSSAVPQTKDAWWESKELIKLRDKVAKLRRKVRKAQRQYQGNVTQDNLDELL